MSHTPKSGVISMSTVNSVTGRGNSLSDYRGQTVYRGHNAITLPSGAISMTDLYDVNSHASSSNDQIFTLTTSGQFSGGQYWGWNNGSVNGMGVPAGQGSLSITPVAAYIGDPSNLGGTLGGLEVYYAGGSTYQLRAYLNFIGGASTSAQGLYINGVTYFFNEATRMTIFGNTNRYHWDLNYAAFGFSSSYGNCSIFSV